MRWGAVKFCRDVNTPSNGSFPVIVLSTFLFMALLNTINTYVHIYYGYILRKKQPDKVAQQLSLTTRLAVRPNVQRGIRIRRRNTELSFPKILVFLASEKYCKGSTQRKRFTNERHFWLKRANRHIGFTAQGP